jgi:hypothetical protein
MKILSILIALIFIYFILSLIVSGIIETINKWRSRRGKYLFNALEKVFKDDVNKNYTSLIYDHPIIESMKKSINKLPSYIPSEKFTEALVDIIIREDDAAKKGLALNEEKYYAEFDTFKAFKDGLTNLNYSRLKNMLQSFVLQSEDIKELKVKISTWYDDYMDRMGGWFSWDSKKLAFYISVAITLLFNINSIEIIKALYNNEVLTNEIVLNAEKTVNAISQNNGFEEISEYNLDELINYFDSLKLLTIQPDSNINLGAIVSTDSIAEALKTLQTGIQNINTISTLIHFDDLPIGWFTDQHQKRVLNSINEKRKEEGESTITLNEITNTKSVVNPLLFRLNTFLGWIITIIALSFGAPFWFSLLNSLINIRNAGRKPSVKENKN